MLSIDLAKMMQELLTKRSEEVARQTGCCRRQSKLGGGGLVQTLVLSVLRKGDATCGDFAQTAAALGRPVSPQAIDQRCTEKTARCLERLLQEVAAEVMQAEPVMAPLVERFSEVSLQDSTTVSLPDELEPHWRGCNTAAAQGGRSALKVQVRFDLARGGLAGLQIEEGRASDQRTTLQTRQLRPGSLHLRDLGYFQLDVFAEMAQAKAYFVSRVQDGTALYRGSERLSLASFLQHQDRDVVDLAIALGQHHRLPCRLVAVRVPNEVAASRRRALRVKARKKGYTPSKAKLALCAWNMYVTNAGVELLSVDEVLALARMRWQIELLFKLWKSDGGLARVRSGRPWKIACLLFAKLIALIFQHWILLRSCWSHLDRSLRKAARAVRGFAFLLAAEFSNPRRLAAAIDTIAEVITHTAHVDKRRKHPSAFQLLNHPTNCGYRTAA